jgi:phage terminase large subunit
VFDYGLDMLACYWIAIDNHDNWYVYKELYEGLDNGHPTGHIVSSAARRITEMTNEKIYQTIAPPDMRNHQKDTGKSTQDLFYENGIYLTIANNNRVQGWLNLKERLKIIDTLNNEGKPIKTAKLTFFSNCRNVIRTLPQLQRDEKNPNDAANTPHELTHAPDAIRYFCASMAKPTPTKKEVEPKKKTLRTYGK